MANDKRQIVIRVFHVIYGLICWPTKRKKQIMLHLVSLAQNNAWPYSGLEVKTTWEKRNETGRGGYWGWEVVTSEQRTVVLWRMRQRGGLISSTCHPEGFSGLWERDKCIRETKAGRMTQTTKFIWCVTKRQKEANFLFTQSPLFTLIYQKTSWVISGNWEREHDLTACKLKHLSR